MVTVVDGVVCDTDEGLIVAVRNGGDESRYRESWGDMLMRTPSGHYFVYRDWDGYAIDNPRHDFLGLLDETAARIWATGGVDGTPEKIMEIRFNPKLWDEPIDGRTRVTVTLSGEVLAKLRLASAQEGCTISQLLDDICRDAWRMDSLT